MLDPKTARELLLAAGNLPGVRDLKPVDDRGLTKPWAKSLGVVAAVEGWSTVEETALKLRIGLSAQFPSELPFVFVDNARSLGFLPHVGPSAGRVCYKSPEGLSVSIHEPGRVLSEGVGFALGVLADSISGRNRSEIADEIEAYWREFSSNGSVPSYVEPNGRTRLVTVGVTKGAISYVADTFEQVRSVDPSARRPAEQRYAPYVPLPRAATDAIEDPRTLLRSVELRAFVEEHVDPSVSAQLERELKPKHYPLVILALARPDRSRSLVAVHFPGAPYHPLVSGKKTGSGKLIPLTRLDRSTLRARGGACDRLGRTRVAVVGCGSVGGYVAMMLAKAGVGELVLLDHDKLGYENAFRHVLGASGIGRPKVEALKDRLDSAVPYIEVTALEHKARTTSAKEALQNVDLVVVAVGNPSENRMINDMLHGENVPAIYTWLEPLGIGGHALLAYGSDGCYECLFVDDQGEQRLTARSDFAASGQQFAQDITGCATAFTPYGDLDARRTAQLATRVALDTLLDRETCSSLRSWKGDPAAFHEKNLRLAVRFDVSEEDLNSRRYDFSRCLCPVCGSGT